MLRTLLCRLMGRHRPALVVVGYVDDHPVTACACPRCGKRKHARVRQMV